jgi:hypothetical protein
MGAASLADEIVAEEDRRFVDDLGFLVGAKLFVAAVRRDEAVHGGS